jgi:hypothetical protein
MSRPQPSVPEHVESGTSTPSPAALLLPRHVTLLLYNYTQPRILRPYYFHTNLYKHTALESIGANYLAVASLYALVSTSVPTSIT